MGFGQAVMTYELGLCSYKVKKNKAEPLGGHLLVGSGNPEMGRDDVLAQSFLLVVGVGGRRANRVS